MCLAAVYIDNNGQKEEVMRDVAWIEPESRGVLLISFLGERQLFQTRIKSIDLVHGSIVLEGKKEAEDKLSG
jgi:predicted RNA-binding protein